jgi:hypothetical protein
MRKQLIVAGIAAATLIPTFAFAQQTCEDRRNNRVAGTVVGGVLGAIAGSAVAGHGDRNEGAVIGGLGGAVIGNQVSKGSADCQHAYGYYDNSNQWHANSVNREMASGYYDRNGAWVSGAPSGGWDRDGRWNTASANTYSYPASYQGRSNRRDAPQDVRQRADWLDTRIQRGRNDGSLSRREASDAMRSLNSIRQQDQAMRRHGQLRGRDEAIIQAKLDDLNSRIRWARQN